MTRRRTGVRGWLLRAGAAATLVPVLLAALAGSAWADGSGRLGQTPPALSWIDLTDSRGIPIWNYELSLDRGGITSPDKFFWSAITDSAWGAYRSWCALALWFLDWVLSFDWLPIVAAPLLRTGDALASVVTRIGAVGTLLTITAVVAVVWMMRGRWATGVWELSIALVIAALASGVFAQPVRMLAGEGGLIAQSQQWGLQLSAALADGPASDGRNADQLRKAQAGQMVDTFIRIPTQMINFGQVLDGGKCESVYTEVVKAGPHGTESTIRDKVNACDPALGTYAASPSASMALGSLLFAPASLVILLLAIVLAGSMIAAGCNAMYQGLKAIVTLVSGLLPGGGRGSLLLTVAETVIALVIILFTAIFLGIFLQVIQAVFKSSTADAAPKAFVIVDVLLVVGIVIYRRQRQRFKDAAARMADLMAKRPGQGVRPTRLPSQHGGGLRPAVAGAARSAVSLAQLRAMRAARSTSGGGITNVDARRQAVIFARTSGAGDGPIDIGPLNRQPPPPSPDGQPGGHRRPPLPGARRAGTRPHRVAPVHDRGHGGSSERQRRHRSRDRWNIGRRRRRGHRRQVGQHGPPVDPRRGAGPAGSSARAHRQPAAAGTDRAARAPPTRSADHALATRESSRNTWLGRPAIGRAPARPTSRPGRHTHAAHRSPGPPHPPSGSVATLSRAPPARASRPGRDVTAEMRRLLIALMVLAAAAVTVLVVARPDTPTPSSSSPSPAVASTPPTPAPQTTPPPPATPTAAPAVSIDPPHEPAGTPVPATGTVPTGSGEQSAAWAQAVARAFGFMHAFARPPAGVNASAWWATVVPYLSPAAAADYAGTDPANVPFTTVTGPATVVPVEAPTDLVIVVRVPTDAGDYLVDIQTTPTGQWVTRATPPSR